MPRVSTPCVRPADGGSLGDYCSALMGRCRWNRKVLFLQLPQILLEAFNPRIAERRGYYAFPPTGLQCLYEALKTLHLDVRILDLNLLLLKRSREDPARAPARWTAILEECLDSFDPSVVGVSCMFDANIPLLTEGLALLRRRDRSIVLVGGIIPTYEWRWLLERDLCHFVLKGESENKIICLFDHLAGRAGDGPPVPGICFRRDGQLYETSGPADAVSFASDMIDSYAAVPIEEYHEHGSLNPFSRMSGKPFAAIQMNRGCRGRCRFCTVPDFMGRGVRGRPVDAVFREMEYLVTQRGVRHFEWLDDDLLSRRREIHALLKRIISAGWGITWSASNGLIATSLDAETMGLMRDSGCIGFRVGVETGNAEMLKRTRKPATLAAFWRVAELVADYPEMFVCGNIMLGFPGETFSQMMDSFRFALGLQLDWTGFTTCQPIRGAGMFEHYADLFDEQMAGTAAVENYIPVRRSAKGELAVAEGARRSLDVFRIPAGLVPQADQVKEIWFTFNLLGNYLNNKNLRPGGRPEKFIAWVETAQVPYPTNPNMNLFLALAHRICGNSPKAEEYRTIAAEHCQGDYWRGRFEDFELSRLLEDFPAMADEAFEVIRSLRDKVARLYERPGERREAR